MGVVSGGYVQSTSTFTFGGAPTISAADVIFVNGHGPLTVASAATNDVVIDAASDGANIFTNAAGDTQTDLTQTNGAYPAHKTAAVSDNTAISISDGGHRGGPTDAFNGVTSQALYKVLHTTGYIGTVVTESASATTFQYVSQCSNRGTCDSSTGICKCFKGYSNDNCDNQNMLA